MRPNPISFLLLSMLMVAMLGGLILLTIMSLDIHFEQGNATFSMDSSGIDRISVINTNGEVDIHGSNSSYIIIGIMKETYLGRDSLDKVQVNVTTVDGELKVRVNYDLRIPFFTVNLDLGVPELLTLTEARLTNGHLRITNVKEAVKAHVVNGRMTVTEVDRIGSLSIENGDLSASGAVSVGSVRVVNGNIALENVKEVGSIHIDNGDVITAKTETVDSIEVSNGNIRLELLSIAPNGTELEMQAGDINVYIQENATFAFDLKVMSGSVSIDGFEPDYASDRYDSKSGDVGGGPSTLKCRVRTGSIGVKAFKGV